MEIELLKNANLGFSGHTFVFSLTLLQPYVPRQNYVIKGMTNSCIASHPERRSSGEILSQDRLVVIQLLSS
jgi:hypothetical protein